jgi:pimeloyl-ACP methyl ester carboxylesterase
MAGASVAAALAACQPIRRPAQPAAANDTKGAGSVKLQKVVANGVELHYVEQGQGDPLVLVHGALNDYREWEPQLARFSSHYRVIAYSRRYNYPNQNPEALPDYSALDAAEDLAAFVRALDLGPSHIIGYSYGAFATLAFALEHPEMVNALVLAEPPLLRWALGLPGGDALYADFMSSFWHPVGDAFRQGDKELALRISINFFAGADLLDELPPEVRQLYEENLWDWEVQTTSSDAFPMIDKEQVAQMQIPTLLLTAENTQSIQQLVNDELERLLPQGTRVTIADATHEMWAEKPEEYGAAMLAFLQAQA